jgi:hypothetical protein
VSLVFILRSDPRPYVVCITHTSTRDCQTTFCMQTVILSRSFANMWTVTLILSLAFTVFRQLSDTLQNFDMRLEFFDTLRYKSMSEINHK